jgi:hypothetical protein
MGSQRKVQIPFGQLISCGNEVGKGIGWKWQRDNQRPNYESSYLLLILKSTGSFSISSLLSSHPGNNVDGRME